MAHRSTRSRSTTLNVDFQNCCGDVLGRVRNHLALSLQCCSASRHYAMTYLAKRIPAYPDFGNEKRIDGEFQAVKQRSWAVLPERDKDREETGQRHASVKVQVRRRVDKAIRKALHHLVTRHVVVCARRHGHAPCSDTVFLLLLSPGRLPTKTLRVYHGSCPNGVPIVCLDADRHIVWGFARWRRNCCDWLLLLLAPALVIAAVAVHGDGVCGVPIASARGAIVVLHLRLVRLWRSERRRWGGDGDGFALPAKQQARLAGEGGTEGDAAVLKMANWGGGSRSGEKTCWSVASAARSLSLFSLSCTYPIRFSPPSTRLCERHRTLRSMHLWPMCTPTHPHAHEPGGVRKRPSRRNSRRGVGAIQCVAYST